MLYYYLIEIKINKNNILSLDSQLLEELVDIVVLGFFDLPKVVDVVAHSLHALHRVSQLVQLSFVARYLRRLHYIALV